MPKRFKVKNNLPGNSVVNEERLKKVSLDSIKDEKVNHENSLKFAQKAFEKSKSKLKDLFDNATADIELERVEKHLKRVENKMKTKKQNKANRDTIENVANAAQNSPEKKRRRRFKRKYLQPQPNKTRRRRTKRTAVNVDHMRRSD